MSATDNSIVKLENLSKVYHMGAIDVIAISGINLAVHQGEMVAIVGASGSGKSTLLHIIGCLDRPTSGKYYFEGTDVRQLNDDRLAEMRNRRLGFVFQQYNLLPRASAVANVELPMVYNGRGNKHRLAMESLERVGLAHRARHKPTELSGGEQQRVAIARALVNKPSLLLADEPTGNLDSVSAAEIMAIFQSLNREGITIVMITHEIDLTKQCNRIIRLYDGRIKTDEKV